MIRSSLELLEAFIDAKVRCELAAFGIPLVNPERARNLEHSKDFFCARARHLRTELIPLLRVYRLPPIAAARCVIAKKGPQKMKTTLTWVDPADLDDNTTPIPAGDFAFMRVSQSVDNGQTYNDIGHAAPGQESFVVDLAGIPPGNVLFKLNAVDSQTPPLIGDDSPVVSVSIATPALLPIGPATDVAASPPA